MYATILVPLDGSQRAERILPHVEALAQRCKSTVILLQVIDPMTTVMPFRGGGPVLAPTLLDEYTKNSQHYLSGLQTKLRAKQLEVKSMIKIGAPVTTILEMAEQENADLIAMASHGRTGLARVFYGSVTAGIMQQVDRPLLLIRAQE